MNNSPHGGAGQSGQVENKGKNSIAIFAYLWILIVIPFLTNEKNDPFVKYHLKQGLALIVFDVVGWLVSVAIGWFPIIGWLIVWLFWIASLVLVIIGIVNVLNGQEKELPLIGQYAKKFNF
jgi:uncharacterized membrane protein